MSDEFRAPLPRFISVDPGGHYTGVAVFGFDPLALDLTVEHVSTVCIDKILFGLEDIVDRYGDRTARLKAVERLIRDLLDAWDPIFFVSEAAHFNPRNFQAYGSLTECTTMMRNAVITHGRGIPHYIIEASVVKKAVGVSGNSGDKTAMGRAIVNMGLVDNVDGMDEHSVDAIAIGYAKFQQLYLKREPHERIEHRKGTGKRRAKKLKRG